MKANLVISAVVLTAAFAALAEKQPYERYESLVTRQMFGPLPPGFDPTKMPSEVQKSGRGGAGEQELTEEQQKIKQMVRFSAIDVRPDGTIKVGFTDMSIQNDPRSYFLAVGESRNGWTVKEANSEDATMTIEKDGVELELTLGSDTAKGGDASKSGQGVAGGRSAVLGNSPLSLRGRRAERQAQEAAQAAAAEKQREEEAARREEEKAERAEQRNQLLAIQEELKKAREARAAEEKDKKESGDGENESE